MRLPEAQCCERRGRQLGRFSQEPMTRPQRAVQTIGDQVRRNPQSSHGVAQRAEGALKTREKRLNRVGLTSRPLPALRYPHELSVATPTRPASRSPSPTAPQSFDRG